MVLHLLTLDRGRTEQRPSAVEQVAPRLEVLLVDEEILLLGTDGRADAQCFPVAKQAKHAKRRRVYRVHRAEQGGLGVQRLTRIRAKRRGYVERAVTDKRVRRGIPCGVSPRLEGRAKSARGEGGGVRLTLDELLARELHDRLATANGGEEGIVLLGGNACQRLEPMGEMGRTVLDGPILHCARNDVGDAAVDLVTVCDGGKQGFVYLLWQALAHDVLAEHL